MVVVVSEREYILLLLRGVKRGVLLAPVVIGAPLLTQASSDKA